MSDDLVRSYLAGLRAKLRVKDAELILAEAEDHLRESVAAGLAIGMTEAEAQEAAISAFGPVRTVVRAHRASRAWRVQLAGDLVLAVWKLGWIGMFAIAGSGLLALAMDLLFGRSFVGRAPAGTTYSAAKCQYWLTQWPGAHTCAQAATLETSVDVVTERLVAGGLGGLFLLAGYLIARALWRRRAVQVVPRGFFAGTAVVVFGAGALVLAVLTLAGSPAWIPATGPGAYLSGALAALAVAAAYLPAARRALRTTASG